MTSLTSAPLYKLAAPEWSEQAPCAHMPGWARSRRRGAPGMSDDEKRAVCATCPVRAQCKAHGDRIKATAEVWGGIPRGAA